MNAGCVKKCSLFFAGMLGALSLHADTLGYWRMDDGAVSGVSTVVVSSVNAPAMNGVTKILGTATNYPSAAEGAGFPVWSLASGSLSLTNAGSLLFTQVNPADGNKNGNYVAITNTSVFRVPDSESGSTAIRPFTFEFFARVNRHMGQWTDLCALQRATSGGGSFGFQISDSGVFVLRVDWQPIGDYATSNGYNKTLSMSFSQLRDGTWHHIALTYDGDRTAKVYGDYMLLGTMSMTNAMVYDVNATTCLALGWGNQAFGKPFDGWIDEVRLSSGILAPDDFIRVKAAHGYWPMNAGVSGSAVSALPNLSSSAYSGYTKAVTTNNEAFTPVVAKWTNLVPVAHAQNFLVEHAASVQRIYSTVVFSNASPVTAAHSGSQVYFNNPFISLTNFTAEVFACVRTPVENALIMGRENASGLAWGVVVLANGMPALVVNGTPYSAAKSIADGAFHHFAVKYDHLAAILKLYVDYTLTATASGSLELNSRAAWVLGAGGNVAAFDGWMCGARVSEELLSIAQMLMLKTVNSALFGYWQFNDQTNAYRLAGVNGEIRSADQNPLLSARGFVNGGTATNVDATPYFSEDVPAPYIWNAASRRIYNAKNRGSIRFVNGVTSNLDSAMGSCVSVTNTFVTMPTNLTVELFAKMTERGILYPCMIEKQGSGTTWMLDMNGNSYRPRVRIDTPRWGNWNQGASVGIGDQKWHHIALQLQQISATNYAVRIFVDYTNRLDSFTTTNGLLNYVNSPLRFGSGTGRAWDGWLDEPRITGAILGTNEFLRAFVPATQSRGYWALDKGSTTNIYYPQIAYAQAVLGSRVEATEGMTPQAAMGADALPPNTVYVTEGRRSMVRRAVHGSTRFTSADTALPARSGSEIRIPYAAVLGITNFTAETFFKVNAATERGVLFGQYQQLGLNWAVQLTSEGALMMRFDTLADGGYYPEGVKQEVALAAVDVADDQWHHVALTYDAVTATAQLYVDYVLAATLTLTQPFWPSTDDLVLGAGDTAFDGWMNSFRMTDAVLTSEQFLYAAPSDGTILLVR